jgi:hypothetical protein
MNKRVLYSSLCDNEYIISGMLINNQKLVIYNAHKFKYLNERDFYSQLETYLAQLHDTIHNLDEHVFIMENNHGMDAENTRTFLHQTFPNITMYYENPNRPGYTYCGRNEVNMSSLLNYCIDENNITCVNLALDIDKVVSMVESLEIFGMIRDTCCGEFTRCIASLLYFGREWSHL